MNLKKATSILLVCSIFVIIIAIAGCSIGSNYIKNIDLKDVKEMIQNKDTFILLISRKDCPNCQEFEPKLKDITNEYKIKVYKIDTYYLSLKEKTELNIYASYSGTPTVEFFEKGNEVSSLNRIVGNVDKTDIIQKFKDNGYIKE